MAARILSIGECMVELRQAEGGLMRKGFAGDTFNMAYYLRALLPASIAVDYFTAIGTDTVSDELLAFMQEAGIGTGHVMRVEGRAPGLYMIHLKEGERSFTYWRSHSAARLLAEDAAALRAAIAEADVVFFSGITLAILERAALATLLAELGRAKQAGKIVAFDPNIRPALWADEQTMRTAITAGARVATMVLPGFDDERTHFGDASVEATIARFRGLGVEIVVVKDGAAGVTMSFAGGRSFVPAVALDRIVDTTGAGDSFNGAFLAAYVQGVEPGQAARFAAQVAARVVGEYGALVDTDALPRLPASRSQAETP